MSKSKRELLHPDCHYGHLYGPGSYEWRVSAKGVEYPYCLVCPPDLKERQAQTPVRAPKAKLRDQCKNGHKYVPGSYDVLKNPTTGVLERRCRTCRRAMAQALQEGHSKYTLNARVAEIVEGWKRAKQAPPPPAKPAKMPTGWKPASRALGGPADRWGI